MESSASKGLMDLGFSSPQTRFWALWNYAKSVDHQMEPAIQKVILESQLGNEMKTNGKTPEMLVKEAIINISPEFPDLYSKIQTGDFDVNEMMVEITSRLESTYAGTTVEGGKKKRIRSTRRRKSNKRRGTRRRRHIS
jgi:hypothetical protein